MRVIKNGLTVTLKGREIQGECACGCVALEIFDNLKWSFEGGFGGAAFAPCPECKSEEGLYFKCSPA